MLKEMKTHNHLKPGQKGTKRLVEKYGDALVCVRYRIDERRGVRLKTVEIVIEEKPWQQPFRFRDGDIVPVPVTYEEKALWEKLRKAGGRWDPLTKVWLVPYGFVRGTELEARISESFISAKIREVRRLPI